MRYLSPTLSKGEGEERMEEIDAIDMIDAIEMRRDDIAPYGTKGTERRRQWDRR